MELQLNKAFQYLDVIASRVADYPLSNEWIIDEFHLSGSRYSGKTTNFSIELAKVIAICLKLDKKVAFYCSRYLTRMVAELVNEILIAIDDLGLTYRYNKSRGLITFANGSFISVFGVYSPTGRVSLKGLSKAYGFDYMISWVEEANELKNSDFQNIYFAIRGAKQFIKVTTCNPDIIYQDHIKWLNDNNPFDEYSMMNHNQQLNIKMISRFRTLFHYSNFKVNDKLPMGIINQLEKIKQDDPVRAKPWYYGLPGALAGSVFGNYLPRKLSVRTFDIYALTGGVDLGFSESPNGHPTSAVLVSTNREGNKFHVEGQYFHNNLDMKQKTNEERARDIVDFYYNLARKYSKRIDVFVDYGAGGLPMIDIMNSYVHNKGIGGLLNIIPVDKALWKVKDRVEIIQIMLSKRILSWDDNVVPELTRTMALMKYKDVKNSESYKIDIVDLNDDGFDSVCYAIMVYMKSLYDMFKNDNVLISKTFKPPKLKENNIWLSQGDNEKW